MITKISVVLMLFMVSMTSQASFRCDGEIIQVGDPEVKVVGACGFPSSETKYQSGGLIHNSTGGAREMIGSEMNKVIYNFGPEKFMQILTYKNGILVDIKDGGYGYTPNR